MSTASTSSIERAHTSSLDELYNSGYNMHQTDTIDHHHEMRNTVYSRTGLRTQFHPLPGSICSSDSWWTRTGSWAFHAQADIVTFASLSRYRRYLLPAHSVRTFAAVLSVSRSCANASVDSGNLCSAQRSSPRSTASCHVLISWCRASRSEIHEGV